MTIQLYLKDTYLLECRSLITLEGEDEKGLYIILDQTVFYPQGGGQPSDHGVIRNYQFEAKVIAVKQVDNEIRHYIDLPLNMIHIGLVNCYVDKERRILNSRYHTAGHLLGNIVEKLYPRLKAVKGHSFPGEAYVEFDTVNDQTESNIEMNFYLIQSTVREAIVKNYRTNIFEINHKSFEQQFYKLPYNILGSKEFRAMQIGDMLPVPCGGTHLSTLGEISTMNVSKIKTKNNITRISYELI